jgi:hypothetical protein
MPSGNRLKILLLALYLSCFRFKRNNKSFYFFCLIVCLFACVVEHVVSEGDPACEQANEDQFCDPEPERQCFSIRTSRKDLIMASSISPFDAYFCPSFYEHNPLACFIKMHGFA